MKKIFWISLAWLSDIRYPFQKKDKEQSKWQNEKRFSYCCRFPDCSIGSGQAPCGDFLTVVSGLLAKQLVSKWTALDWWKVFPAEKQLLECSRISHLPFSTCHMQHASNSVRKRIKSKENKESKKEKTRILKHKTKQCFKGIDTSPQTQNNKKTSCELMNL